MFLSLQFIPQEMGVCKKKKKKNYIFRPFVFRQELEQIEAVWDLAKEWERLWEDWKVGTFTELQTSEMETHSITLYKKLNKYSRELKVRSNIIIICFRPFWHFSSVN